MTEPLPPGLTAQLAEDLGWLEHHCSRRPGLTHYAARLRLAAAVVRNCIAPYLDGASGEPFHVAVVGGAGAGKSTAVNFLCGSVVAEANPQAGFTRHPVAYAANGDGLARPGLLGPLQRLAHPAPSSLDQDVYQVRRLAAPPGDDFTARFVVWDCPDMTTFAADNYAPRLVEVAGLADVIVYVASDERYNDAVPTEYLRMLLEVGKPIVAVLTKVDRPHADAMLEHFRREVLGKLPAGRVESLAVTYLSPAELAEPTGAGAEVRARLVAAVNRLGGTDPALRAANARGAVRYLDAAGQHIHEVAKDDLAAIGEWRDLVRAGRDEFADRYRREYLSSDRMRRFDEAMVRLIDLLELPGVGKILSGALHVVRTPFRLLKGLASQMFGPTEVPAVPEQPVLDAAFTAWLDKLRATAARQSGKHPLWQHAATGFDRDLAAAARDQYQRGLRRFQVGLSDEVEQIARAIYEDLEKSPAQLNALRGGKAALDLAAISGAIVTGGVGLNDIILIPLAASVSHQLVEWVGSGYVEARREQARKRQHGVLTRELAEPLAEWLEHWPATGGTPYERLQQVLTRVPDAVRRLDAALTRPESV